MRRLVITGYICLLPVLAFGEWWITTVDSSYVGDKSIVLDSACIPHIAYTKTDGPWWFRYVSFNPTDSSWQLEFAHDTADGPILKFDSKWCPHIAASPNYYIYRDTSGTWHIETPMYWDWGHSFDLDTSDYPHIMETRIIPFDTLIFHSYKDNLGWHEEIISALPPGVTSIVIDDANVIHLTFSDYMSLENLYYAKKVSGVWSYEQIDDTKSGNFYGHRLALDTCGYPCVAYIKRCGANQYKLKFAKKYSESWHITEICDGSDYMGVSSLCIDSNNYPRILYSEYRAAMYAWFDGSFWNITKLDTFKSSGDIVVDKYGYSHIAYSGGGNSPLKYAKGYGFMGVEESEEFRVKSLELKVYPNPFIQSTIIRFKDSRLQIKDCRIQIYNMMGRLVGETGSKVIGDKLSSGIYFVKVKGYKPAKIIKIGGIR